VYNASCDFRYILTEKFLLLRRINRDIVINVHRYPWKVLVTLVGFLKNIEFCKYVLENSQLSIFVKIRPVGAELFHAGEPTERHYGAKRRFSQFFEGA